VSAAAQDPTAIDEAAHAAETRRIIAILSICGFASTFAIRFVDPMIGVIARDLRADPHTIALLSTAFALPYAFIQPILGPVGDALGKERIIKTCLVILVLTLAGSVLTQDVTTLFVLRVLSGAAAGGLIPISLATIGDRVAIGERQVAISRLLVFTISGQLLGGSLSGVLAAWIGWRGVFGLAAALALGALGAVLYGFAGAKPSTGRFTIAVAASRYRTILSLPRARALFAFVFVEGAIVFGIQPYIAPMLEARGAGGPAQAGMIIACFAAGGLLYTVLVRLLLRVLGLGRMLAIAGAIGAAAFVALGLGGPWQLDAAAMLAMGMAFYMLHNSFQTQVTEVVVDGRASAVSLHAFSFFVGQAIGAVLTGMGISALGSFGAAIASGLGVLVLGLVAARTLGRQPRAR
jgi:predicted MFS family arabinose efflux permease